MKKLFLFILPILILGGCSKNTDTGINTGDIEKITQLEEQLSGMIEQFSGLQAENDLLKETLSGAVDLLKSFQTENNLSKNPEPKKDDYNTFEQTNCISEGGIVNQNHMDSNPSGIYKDCCPGLAYFEYYAPAASSVPMCYNPQKGTPQCLYPNTSQEGRYYSDGTPLYLKANNTGFYPCSEL